MIEEQFVSFDTARLLKEAGFDEVCRYAYYTTGHKAVMHERNNMLSPGYISCPTQALAARWLREKFGIHIFANYFFEDGTWFYVTVDLKEPDEVRAINPDIRSYQTSEEALEAGLKDCLEQIKKKEYDGRRTNKRL